MQDVLQLTARVNMYKNLLAAPDMARLGAELQKHYDFRVAELTHAQVEAMDAQAVTIAADNDLQAEETEARPPRGRRKDHDTLPPEIQALYVENLSVLRRMREVHLRLRNLSLETASCPDSERYPFLKELIDLDKKYRSTGRATTNTDPTPPPHEANRLNLRNPPAIERRAFSGVSIFRPASGRHTGMGS